MLAPIGAEKIQLLHLERFAIHVVARVVVVAIALAPG
jgi:hypothetical protein